VPAERADDSRLLAVDDGDVISEMSEAAKLLGCDVTDHQLGVMFGLGYSAVSRRAGILKAKLQESRALQRKFEKVKSRIKT
jgi:hypothetical protein